MEIEPTATFTPIRKSEISLPGEGAEPTATPTRESQPPPRICRDENGNVRPCDEPGENPTGDDGKTGSDDDKSLTGCVMVIDVLSGDYEQVSQECDDFGDKLPVRLDRLGPAAESVAREAHRRAQDVHRAG